VISQLNCSVIKELTGGTSMTVRGIYKAATTFKPNCLCVLQTNKIFGYTEDGNDAMRRRMCIVKHKAKFYTELTKDRLKNLQYSHPSDPKIGEQIRSDQMLWQFLLRLMRVLMMRVV
jgi:phage/plasmid-associated DNA primase